MVSVMMKVCIGTKGFLTWERNRMKRSDENVCVVEDVKGRREVERHLLLIKTLSRQQSCVE